MFILFCYENTLKSLGILTEEAVWYLKNNRCERKMSCVF